MSKRDVRGDKTESPQRFKFTGTGGNETVALVGDVVVVVVDLSVAGLSLTSITDGVDFVTVVEVALTTEVKGVEIGSLGML